MKSNVWKTVSPQNGFQTSIHAGPGERDHTITGGLLLCRLKLADNIIREINCSGGAGGFGGFLHPAAITASDQGLFDRERLLIEIDAVPGQRRDLRRAHTQPYAHQDWKLHRSALHCGEERRDLVRLQNPLLLVLLLRQGRAERQVGVIFGKDGGQQTVDIADGLWGSGHAAPFLVYIGLGLLVDGPLDELRSQPVQLHFLDAGEIVLSDALIPPDGGGGQDAVLAGNIFLHRLIQRHGAAVPAHLFVVGAEFRRHRILRNERKRR